MDASPARDTKDRRRRRWGVHAVTLPAPSRTAAPTFASVAEACLDDVFGYLLYLTRDRALAEDLTGETFETALRRWRRFDPGRGTPRAWLLAIARSTALDWFRADSRRKRREERAGASEPHEPVHEVFEGFSPELEASLQELSAGEREVVALRVVLELDGEETARLLGISPTAVSTRLHRALQKLEERMREHDVVA
jgi:RNA polymerase sigma-70 factor (ECF subfamily)